MEKRALLWFAAACVVGCGTATDMSARSEESRSAREESISCGPLVASGPGSVQVRPSGSEDTRNLQCALDLAVASSRPIEVRLAAGTFFIDVIAVKGFVGRLIGAGAGATTIRNVNRAITVNPSAESFGTEPTPAGGANPNPYLISFIDGDFQVSDLAVHIGGHDPTTGWFLDAQTFTTAFAVAITVLGRHANATFERIVVEGEPGDELFAGKNLGNGVYYQGLIGLDPPPLSGSFEVRDSTFRGMRSGSPMFNVRDGRVRVTRNRYEDLSGHSLDVTDIDGVDFVFTGNELRGGAPRGLFFGDGCFGPSAVCGMSHSSILIAGNDLQAVVPVVMRSTFGEDMRCAVVGNALHADLSAGGVDVFLGSGIHDCVVATAGPVTDLGTGNRVIRR